ncbi:hypothetical protein Tco_1247418 [Tanacetum coccineum]
MQVERLNKLLQKFQNLLRIGMLFVRKLIQKLRAKKESNEKSFLRHDALIGGKFNPTHAYYNVPEQERQRRSKLEYKFQTRRTSKTTSLGRRLFNCIMYLLGTL